MKKIFIANRGEILRRIALTAKLEGLQVIALREERRIPHYLADLVHTWIDLDGPSAYLDASWLVREALKSGADCLHPGFGFLSENSDFAQAVQDAGMIWVGPHPKAVSQMASKHHARELAKAANCPVVPGQGGIRLATISEEALTKTAQQIGYPVLLKAALGGGGKGMRVARNDAELRAFAPLCASEAMRSFGDDELVLEKYLEHPRHVEVQVLGDQHGTVWILGDRDCSVQRRHQKVIEEAPAPHLSDTLRSNLHLAARNLANAVNYYSAGTVEFLVQDGEFYFLEMNTRLQVEHPVTEEIYGVDLVALQIRIARGERLPEHPPLPRGHAVEVRIYAEDCANNFLPSAGPIDAFIPASFLRWEIGVDMVDDIGSSFDPMVAKAVAWAPDRLSAVRRLLLGLEQTVLVGTANNIDFLQQVLRTQVFQQESPSTAFLASFVLQQPQEPSPWVASLLKGTRRPRNTLEAVFSLPPPLPLWAKVGRSEIFVGFEGETRVHLVRSEEHGQTRTHVHLGDGTWYSSSSRRESFQVTASSKDQLCAPVPARILKVNVVEGDQVTQGQVLFVLESMKMQFEVRAERDGQIGKLLVQVNQQVKAKDALARLV